MKGTRTGALESGRICMRRRYLRTRICQFFLAHLRWAPNNQHGLHISSISISFCCLVYVNTYFFEDLLRAGVEASGRDINVRIVFAMVLAAFVPSLGLGPGCIIIKALASCNYRWYIISLINLSELRKWVHRVNNTTCYNFLFCVCIHIYQVTVWLFPFCPILKVPCQRYLDDTLHI